MQDDPEPSEAVTRVLGKALINSKLRTELLTGDPIAAGKCKGLSSDECNELKDTVKRIETKNSGSLDALARVCHIYFCLHGFCPK
jgi:hypothetical protein